jgi:hypothetical protein
VESASKSRSRDAEIQGNDRLRYRTSDDSSVGQAEKTLTGALKGSNHIKDISSENNPAEGSLLDFDITNRHACRPFAAKRARVFLIPFFQCDRAEPHFLDDGQCI